MEHIVHVGKVSDTNLRSEFRNDDIGFYRDDCLAAIRRMGPRFADNLRKYLRNA